MGDCGFAYPLGWTQQQGQELAARRRRFLGIGSEGRQRLAKEAVIQEKEEEKHGPKNG
ncbi:MAG: hypothetical protein WC480_04410 [Patescibacteria group bacterium]